MGEDTQMNTQNKKQPEREGRLETLLSVAFLLVAILFGYHMVSPLLGRGAVSAGDDPIHMAKEFYLVKLLDKKHEIFGWYPIWSLGAPHLDTYPWGFYASTALIHLISLKKISLVFAHKLVVLLCFALYPLSVYYCLNKFGFPKVVCGVAALFALAPLSGWGHTTTAYFNFGLMKQTIPIFLFPIVFGKFHEVVSKGRNPLSVIILLSVIIVSHPFIFFCFGFYVLAYFAVAVLGKGPRDSRTALKRAAFIFVLTFLVCAFWLIPMFALSEFRAPLGRLSLNNDLRSSAFTVGETVHNYVRGGVFDHVSVESTGRMHVSHWKNSWRDNSMYGRWPVLSYFSLLGFLVCLLFIRRFNYAVFCIGFLVSFMLFLAADDVFLFRYIPLQKDFFYIHAIFGLEFFAVCLTAVGLHALGFVFVGKVAGIPRLTKKFSGVFAAVLFVALLSVLLHNVYYERNAMAKRAVDTSNIYYVDGKLGELGLAPINRDYQKVVSKLNALDEEGRVYAHDATNVSDGFYISSITHLTKNPNVFLQAFVSMTGGANLIVRRFHMEVPFNSNLQWLLNTRYILSKTMWDDDFPEPWTNITRVESTEHFNLYRVGGDHSYMDFLEVKPALVFLDAYDWYKINEGWSRGFMDARSPAEHVFFVRSVPSDLSKARDLDPEKFPYAILFDYEVSDEREARRRLTSYIERGGIVYAQTDDVLGIAVRVLENVTHGFRIELPPVSYGADSGVGDNVVDLDYYAVNVSTSGEKLLIFKMAYYPGWRVYVDGRETQKLWVSPGIVGALVPAGEHEVEFKYTQTWIRHASKLLSILALAFLILPQARKKYMKLLT